MACNYCQCEEYHLITDHTRFEKNNVWQCKNCRLVFLEVKEDKEQIESFYSSEYRKLPTRPVRTPEELHTLEVTQNDAANRLQFVSNSVDIRGKRILEIGSASGNLLERLLEGGAGEVTGIEFDEDLAAYLRQRGLNVVTRPLEETGFAAEFDAVVSFHTLEHVYDPMAVIKAVYAALKPGGCFLGEVPNQDDWRIKIFDDEVVKRFHYEPSHYYYYSPVTLKNYLEACGFSNIRLETTERYNSLAQLRNILCRETGENVEQILEKHLFPKTKADEVRLPDSDNKIELEFNRIFAEGVNSELMGNCLRWAACKS